MNTSEDVVARHAKLLMYHDVGDPAFAQQALRFAEAYDTLVRRTGGSVSVRGQVIRSIDRLVTFDRESGSTAQTRGELEDYMAVVAFLIRVLPAESAFDKGARERIQADLYLYVWNTRINILYAPTRSMFNRLIRDGLAFVEAR